MFGWCLDRLTLRHCAALRAMESPLVEGATTSGLAFSDVWLAARICAARDERTLRRAMRPAGGWRASVGGWFGGVRWGRIWPLEWARLAEWLALETDAVPRMLPGAKGGRVPRGDWTIGMWVRLMMAGMRPAEAWWTPLALAAHANVARSEADGREVPLLDGELEAELAEMGWSKEDLGR